MTSEGVPGDGHGRPAVEGWFTTDRRSPALLANRCKSCATFVFPPTNPSCPNPACDSGAFDKVELSRRGRIWSYTDARYRPPAPYVAVEPYEPFCIAAVELEDEKLVVLGQVVPGFGVDDLHVGMEVELTLGFLDDQAEDGPALVWKWRPVANSPARGR